LGKESDRGVALIGAAYLDDILLKLLQAHLIEAASSKEFKEFFSGLGLLSGFSSRIKAAYLLGLIGEKVYRDLEYVRKIRNQFAHNPWDLSFDDQQIKDWCSQLRHYTFHKPAGARDRFINTVSTLESLLGLVIVDAKAATIPADISDDVLEELVKRGEPTSG
jgi:Mannitol repressor